MTELRPCHTRITNKNCKYFADGVHKFYLEYCCMRPCIEGQNRCKSCIKIHTGARSQFDSTYPHGHMSEPIPDHSHIFGGTWYYERIRDWGEPSQEVITLATMCQVEARQFYTIPSPSKVDSVSIQHDMGRPKKVVDEITEIANPEPKKRSRKPKVGILPVVAEIEAPNAEPLVAQVKPKAPRKKTVKTKEEPVIVKEPPRICKEVMIPTYIEENIEEIDTTGYEIEYVPLTTIEIEKITYYQDAKKNKLYQIVRNLKIGPYVGRYCPRTESICTDVPDSDEENDE